jgi:hypothetical protein
MTPKPKPKNYSKILDVLNTPQAAKTFSPKTYIDLVGQYSRKAFDNGEISKKEYMSIVKPLFGDAGIMASDKIKKYKDELNKYANGGRIGFLDGGDTKYNAMVTEMYIKLGGEEGTGMDIDSFAKEYFKKFNQGGRAGFRGGGMDMGAGSSKSSKSSGPAGGASSGGNYGGNKNSGPDRSKVSAQQERNNQAAVREAQAFNQKKEETINRIKEAQPKQSPIRTFFDHTNFTKPLKMVGSIPNYHQLGGYDFMSRFPNTPPSIAKSLGYGYQGLTEGIRSLNPFDNYSFQDAMTRAGEEGRLNALGVDAYGNPTNPITQQYYNLPTTLGPNYNLPTTLGPNKEAQTSGGGGLANFIKNNIAPEYRLYTRTMVPGLKTGRLDEEYFPDDFKLDLRQQALDKYTRTGELSGMVNEADQHMSRGEINKLTKFPSTYATLGTYSYQIDPKTLDVKITDKYDWNPAYGTQGNFTGFVGNQPEKGGRDVDASMLKDYVVNSLKKGIDFPSGLELLGNLLGPRSSKGEGVDIDINIPTEFAAMRADTSYATGGRIRYSEGSPDIEELRKRVEELMDDGETFGDAVKIAVKELEND